MAVIKPKPYAADDVSSGGPGQLMAAGQDDLRRVGERVGGLEPRRFLELWMTEG